MRESEMMARDDWQDRLSEYLDHELEEAESSACEQHLFGCASCSATLAELEAVRARAGEVRDPAPPVDLWPGVAARIRQPEPVLQLTRRDRGSFLSTALAAGIALALLGGGGVWYFKYRVNAPAPNSMVVARPSPLPILPATARAERSYEAAAGDLATILAQGRNRLDTTTVRVLERNLAVIDSAIADAERALASDPRSAYLNAYLAKTMQRKLDVLRRAAELVRS